VVEEVATIDNELAEKLSQPVSVLDPSEFSVF